jgi:hypothetical protein
VETAVPKNLNREEVIVSEHLADLRGRVRLLTWVSGLSWTVLVFFGGLLVSGLLDWTIHFDDPGLRLVIGVSLLGAAGFMAWRQLILPLLQPLTTTFLALRIEQRFPGLHSRVLSAVEFLHHKLDPKLGSPELQQAVVKDALQDLEKIETSDVVETKAIKRITIAGAVLCAMIAIVVLLHPVEAGTSVKRLMFPFADCPWPRQFELTLVRPDMTPAVQDPGQPILIARGDTLELYVVDKRGRLPERVWFEHRLGTDGELQREPLRQTTLRDEKGKTSEAAVISWVASRGPLSFRVMGGDDDTMSFQQVEVVQPPTLESLRVTVSPPKYAGRLPETLPQGVGHVQGLLGTEITVVATADKPLKSAQLRVADKPGKPLKIGEDQLSFTASFKITDPGVTGYWFELTDVEGFSDPEAPRFELRGIADSVPDVVIEQPVADILLSADAELPVKILAKDDLGLTSVRISYILNDDPKPILIPLVTHEADTESWLFSTPDYVWKLAELSLQPGNRIVFRAEALDSYNLGQETHIGRSSPRTISIVSKQEKQKELAGRVGDLLEDLQQATALQQRAKQQTEELKTQLNTAGELRMQDVDQLHRIELDQRQAASRLIRPADGVQSQAQQLQEEFRANKLDDAEMQQRLSRIVDELSQLSRDQLPEIDSALTRASKQAEVQSRQEGENPEATSTPDSKPAKSSPEPPQQKEPGEKTPTPPDQSAADKSNSAESTAPSKTAPRSAVNPELESALSDATTQQTRAMEKLQELQDLLSEWRDQRDVSRELNSLISEQDQLQKDAAELGQQTLSKSGSDLTPQQKADLAKMATRQMKIAEQVDQFRKQLQQAADSLKERDRDAAGRFNDAKEELNSDGTAGKLREAAQDIAENQMGTASQMQQQALQDLRDLDKQLKREPTDDAEMLIKQIEQAQQEFDTLRKEQVELKEQTQQAAGQPNSPQKTEQLEQLRQKQQELSEKVAQAERRLERLRLRPPTEAAERAKERLDRINDQLQDPDQADEATEQMQQVVDDLEQVQRDLALEKRVAQERLAVEELERIEDQLKALQTQQQGVITETERLEAERVARGSLSRGQLRTLRDLAEVERGLQVDAEQMEKSLKVAEVFALVLRRTARSLKLAADRLADKQSDASVIAVERDALKKIESLLLVLKAEDAKPPGDGAQPPPAGQQPEGEEKPQQAQPPGEALPQLAQLKLLKALQEEFLERTQLLDGLRDKEGKLPDQAAQELEELAREQAELADLTRDLVVKILHRQPDAEEVPKDAAKEKAHEKPEAKPAKQSKDKSDLDSLDLDSLDPTKPKKSSTGPAPGAKEE